MNLLNRTNSDTEDITLPCNVRYLIILDKYHEQYSNKNNLYSSFIRNLRDRSNVHGVEDFEFGVKCEYFDVSSKVAEFLRDVEFYCGDKLFMEQESAFMICI